MKKYICCLMFMISIAAVPETARAEEIQPPHLIQTVTEQDVLDGLLELGLLECPALETEDCDMAYENVRDCIVRIYMGNAYGSGVIWEIAPERIVIATNKHVLEYWDDMISLVQFPQGASVEAEVLGISEDYDIGFLAVDTKEFHGRELEQMRYVRRDADRYDGLRAGDVIFCTGAGRYEAGSEEDVAEPGRFYQGSIGDMHRYIGEFEEYMIYGYGYAVEGMSGGGTFDAYGNFIGMISGATDAGETASVPLPVIEEAYETLVKQIP